MARDFSRAFYKSSAWRSCRDSYQRSKGGLCEDCLQRGIITPGAEVHHIVELTPDNIGNPAVTLSWDNLRLLCHACHMKRHAGDGAKRYRIDQATGAVVTEPPYLPKMEEYDGTEVGSSKRPGGGRTCFWKEIGRDGKKQERDSRA